METKAGTLAALGQGERALVIRNGVPGSLGQRLEDMGLIPGTKVSCRMGTAKTGLGAYELRGTVIALRRRDAGLIAVEALPW